MPSQPRCREPVADVEAFQRPRPSPRRRRPDADPGPLRQAGDARTAFKNLDLSRAPLKISVRASFLDGPCETEHRFPPPWKVRLWLGDSGAQPRSLAAVGACEREQGRSKLACEVGAKRRLCAAELSSGFEPFRAAPIELNSGMRLFRMESTLSERTRFSFFKWHRSHPKNTFYNCAYPWCTASLTAQAPAGSLAFSSPTACPARA